MGGTVGDLIRLGLSKVGYAYSTGPSRTTGADGYFDCSGFTYFLNQNVGGPTPGWDPQSHLQALFCRDHGLLVPGQVGSQAQIDAAPIGACLFEGPAHAYIGGAGIPGHVAVKIGDNKTVEAMGHAWGTCVGRIHGRNWSNAGLFPSIDYGTSDSGGVNPDSIEGPQLGDDMSAVIPAHAKYVNGLKPWFQLDLQEGNVLAHNGARLTWRMPPGTKAPAPFPFDKVVVYPIPINGPFVDMSEGEVVRVVKLNDGEELHLTQKDGSLVVVAANSGVATADIVLP